MKVVFCAQDRPGNFSGGPNAWLLRLLPDLTARGVEVLVLVTGCGPESDCPFVQGLIHEKIRYRFLDTSALMLYLEQRIRWIARQLNDFRADIFVPNLSIPGYYTAEYARRAGIPTVGVIHSDDQFHHQLLRSFAFGSTARRVSALIVVSKHLESTNRPHLPEDVELYRIPYGVPIPKIAKPERSRLLRICYIGRFRQEQKRILDLTKAFCRAALRLPETRYSLLGNGPEENKMRKIIAEYDCKDRVRIEPALPSSEIGSFLAAQDVFVLLSDYEGLPIALQEAMASGVVPVCLHERSGIAELVENGRTGLVVADRDDGFLSALALLDGDRGQLERLSTNARQFISEQYSSTDQHEIWLELLGGLSLLSSPKKIVIPSRLGLPAAHPDFRGEDIPYPPLGTRVRSDARKWWWATRYALRPRSRLRALLTRES